jgi:Fur family ferric uptake transcriptional regulator
VTTTPNAARPASRAPGATVEEREAAILAEFRSRGGRVTSARRAIVRVLLTHPAHLSTEELAAIVQRQLPDVHQSSVYRNLAELERMGVIRHVHFGHGASMYRLADDIDVYLVCETCGRTTAVPRTELGPLVATLRARFGFDTDLSHFALVGRCRDHPAI